VRFGDRRTGATTRWWTGWSMALASMAGLVAGPVQAGTMDFANGSRLEYLLNLTYSAATRVDEPAGVLEANINGDDGNRNFEVGQLLNNRVSALGELGFEWGRYGVFARGNAFYDAAIMDEDPSHDAPSRRNRDGDPNRFSDEIRDRLGERARMLDAYVYGAWDLFGTSLSIRAGEQVVSWGESLFFPNTSGAQSPADATRSNVPGREVKDILLPMGQVLVQWGISYRLGLSAYVQYDDDYTELNPIGAYFSTTDVVGPGADFLIVEDLPLVGDQQIRRLADIRPTGGPQWGVSASYLLGTGTEVAVQYLRHHDKNPTGVEFQNAGTLDVLLGNSTYRTRYFDAIDLASASLSANIGSTAVTAEISHRWGAGVNVDAPVIAGENSPTPTRADVWQANIGAFHILLPSAFWDRMVLVGEISGVHVAEVDPLRIDGSDFDRLTNTRNAAAAQGQMLVTYQQVIPGWDVEITLAHANAFEGQTAVAGSLGSLTGQGDRRYRIALAGIYLANLRAEIAYDHFDGGPDPTRRGLADRSFAAFSATYSF